MTHSMPAILAQALAPFAPRQSVVHQIVNAETVDRALHLDKLTDGYARRADAQAMKLQRQYQDATGSVL